MDQDYMTIKEFATKVGVTSQAIYKRLSTDLQPYLNVVDNKKTLNKKALSLFDNVDNNEVDKQVNQQLINLLSNQLVEKDKHIKELLERNKELNFLLARQQEQPQLSSTEEGETVTVKKRWYHKFLN